MPVDQADLEAIADKLENIVQYEHGDVASKMANVPAICHEAATLIRRAMAETIASGKKK